MATQILTVFNTWEKKKNVQVQILKECFILYSGYRPLKQFIIIEIAVKFIQDINKVSIIHPSIGCAKHCDLILASFTFRENIKDISFHDSLMNIMQKDIMMVDIKFIRK